MEKHFIQGLKMGFPAIVVKYTNVVNVGFHIQASKDLIKNCWWSKLWRVFDPH
jgi:hypothetical protein